MPRSRSRGRRQRRAAISPSNSDDGDRRRGGRSRRSSERGRDKGDEGKRKDKKAGGSASGWICGSCGGPHKTKECPMAGGAGGAMNPMMMMGMMRPPMMGMPGMPGMAGMGAMGMMGMPGATSGKKGKAPADSEYYSEEEEESEEEESPPPRRSSRRKDKDRGRRRSRSNRKPIRLREVDDFLDDNRINEEAALKIRMLSPESQRKIIERPLTGDVQNPSKVMIARVREHQSQREQAKAAPDWMSGFLQGSMGVSADALEKFTRDNDLDDDAARMLKGLAPHQQAEALKFDLSKYKNRSAKFMTMASKLPTSARSAMPPAMPGMPPMMGMPAMPMMGMPPMAGMPPMMPMPGMMGMPPGMPPPSG